MFYPRDFALHGIEGFYLAHQSTGHTLDGNPQAGCVEAAVRSVALPAFSDEHFETHYTFMLR